jgi:RNase H-fold protein (predicted Holliday junction resolvase)
MSKTSITDLRSSLRELEKKQVQEHLQ